MKIISSALVISILFSGCATRNAFSKLDISKEQEAAIENTKSGKIIFDKKVEGIYSAVYLNNVYENTDKTNNYFYISLYLKNKNNYLNITLNGEKAIDRRELAQENKYSHLVSLNTQWTSNYLLRFKNNENNESTKLILQIDNGPSSSGPLSYSKDQL
ncbi:MAG: hypothetical protein Q9M32_08090 [Sulfurimonas sp.]|nr:hypothetical protein [Sulfurimonas sp.]